MDEYVTKQDKIVESFEVESSTSTSIQVEWLVDSAVVELIEYFRVHYQKIGSTYIQYGPKLSSSVSLFNIRNLVADTYYKVCLVTKRNHTGPLRQCVDASTTNWPFSVSIGSSVGAILALSIIVLIVLLSRCQVLYICKRKCKAEPKRYDPVSAAFYEERYFDFSEKQANDGDCMSDTERTGSGYKDPNNIQLIFQSDSAGKSNCGTENSVIPLSSRSRLLRKEEQFSERMYVRLHGSQRFRTLPKRAYSIGNAQHSCCICESLASNSERRHSMDDSLPTFMELQDQTTNSPLKQCDENESPKASKVTPKRHKVLLRKQRSVTEQDEPTS